MRFRLIRVEIRSVLFFALPQQVHLALAHINWACVLLQAIHEHRWEIHARTLLLCAELLRSFCSSCIHHRLLMRLLWRVATMRTPTHHRAHSLVGHSTTGSKSHALCHHASETASRISKQSASLSRWRRSGPWRRWRTCVGTRGGRRTSWRASAGGEAPAAATWHFLDL